MAVRYGKVYIVGVGPGDYKLLTLKAVECLQKADAVVYDRLINSRILGLAREDAELVYAGKLPGCHAIPQEGINEILVKLAQEGKQVARVKGGDPFLFGRGGEEAEVLRENGIEFEIVPGVTSAVAVPAYAGIPVTHRDYSSSVHIITGHERPDKEGKTIDYKVLAKTGGTLVFLMAVKSLPEIARGLMDAGKSGSTPAAVIENGTTGKQRVIEGALEEMPEKAERAGIQSPAVIIVGDVAKLGEKIGWRQKGRLSGRRVIVTRSREQAGVLAERIESLGGEALEFPVIKIADPVGFERMDEAIANADRFQWLVFTSANGVDAFFRRMRAKRADVRTLAGIRLAAVGGATAEELEQYGVYADYVPEKYTTEELTKGLVQRIRAGEKVLLARAEAANGDLAEGLAARGVDVVDLVVYRTLPDSRNKEELLRLVEEGAADYITFASSSAVRHFLSAIGRENIPGLSNTKIVCIGPVTAATAAEEGLEVAAVAGEHTINGLLEKLVEISEG